MPIQTAYFAGGCFWCITPFFKMNQGVLAVTAGYSGGDEKNPAYPDVKSGKTGHRETVAVRYDSDMVSFSDLLEIFLAGVDPYDEGGQFIDRGHSYTLAVYVQGEAESTATHHAIAALEAESGRRAYISIEPFKAFYPAEEEHQDYYLKNPEAFEEELTLSGRKKQ